MRTCTAVTAALLLATLTACSESDNPPSTASPKPGQSAATEKPSPTPTEAAPSAFGKAIDVKDPEGGTDGTMAVLGYEQGKIKVQASAAEESGMAGYVWAALELKFCATKGTSGITSRPWVLAYADGARIEPSDVTYGDFPKPEYPNEAMVKEGDCVRGKTVFAVPGNQRPERVLYTTELFPTPPEWAVPKA